MHMHKTILFQLALAFILALNSSNLMAQTDGVTTPQPRQRQYTKETVDDGSTQHSLRHQTEVGRGNLQ